MVLYHSFLKLKSSVTLEQLIPYLGLEVRREGRNFRGRCPFCKSGGNRAFVLNTERNLWYCHGKCRIGGDQITLVSRINRCSLEDAANQMFRDFHLGSE